MKQAKKLRALLDFGELVYVLAERLKKKDPPGKIYKISTENEPFVIKSQVFTIPKRVVFNNGFYNYQPSKRGEETIIDKRFISKLYRKFI